LKRESKNHEYGFNLVWYPEQDFITISNVFSESIAFKAGLRDGDILLAINGKSINKIKFNINKFKETIKMMRKYSTYVELLVQRKLDGKCIDYLCSYTPIPTGSLIISNP
jgi:C-terminal processing protease CtpA/Prc